jgi:hypothetical protein
MPGTFRLPPVISQGISRMENVETTFPPSRPGLKTLFIAIALVVLVIGIKFWTEIQALFGF